MLYGPSCFEKQSQNKMIEKTQCREVIEDFTNAAFLF